MHYKDEDNDKIKGMRIKMTIYHSSASHSAPLRITESVLDESKLTMTEEEFKNYKGMFAIKAQGLTTNGGTKPMGQGHGHIVFTRSIKHRN